MTSGGIKTVGVGKLVVYSLLGIATLFVLKLVFFDPFDREVAARVANEIVASEGGRRGFDIRLLGEPKVTGTDDAGYSITWTLISEKGGRILYVIIGVSYTSDNYSGSPFMLDCRPGFDVETRTNGFGYLCVGADRKSALSNDT